MIDRTGAARLEWRHWDRFTKVILNIKISNFSCDYLNYYSCPLSITLLSITFQLPDGVVAYTDDAFVARKQRHQMSNKIMDKKLSKETKDQKVYELGDLNLRRSLSGDIAVYNFHDDYGNNLVKKKWEVK